MKKLVLSFGVLIVCQMPIQALGWGQTGHRITAEIAQRNLSTKAQKAIKAIIGNQTLAELSTWPDEIRSDANWDAAKPWHYVNIADDESFSNYQQSPKGDVVVKLAEFEKVLKSSIPDKDKRNALAFYLHFVGDIHQPLHVGRREDRGGNMIEVQWFGIDTNLHAVWDELIIESTDLSYTEFSSFLNRVSHQARKVLNSSIYTDWANESRKFHSAVYDFGKQKSERYLNTNSPPVLGNDYRSKALPIVKDRLQQGGIRLAGKLNEIFD